MESKDLIVSMVLMLVGGLATSVGLVQVARSERGRRTLSGVGTKGLGLLVVGAFGVPAGVGYWLWRRLGDATDVAAVLDSPVSLFAVGAAVGLPMALPGLVTAWNEMRPEKLAEREKKRAEATRSDRAAYAADLATQIRHATLDRSEFLVEARGQEGRVLWLEGDLDQPSGERLIAALRADLTDHGFNRVECRSPRGNWWAPV